jgi:hypothetical protein
VDMHVPEWDKLDHVPSGRSPGLGHARPNPRGIALRRWASAAAFLLTAGLLSGCSLPGRTVQPADEGAPRTFYIKPTGHDANAGTSPRRAWRTTARLNQVVLRPGDRVLLQGGATFSGGIMLDEHDSGTAAAPILITSSGRGRATIDAGAGKGLYAHNTAGLRIENVNFAGAGRASNDSNGIDIYTDLPGDRKLEHVQLQDVSVSGFGKNGVRIGGWNGRTGFRDVRLVRVDASHNGNNGILVYGQEMYANEQIYIGRSRAQYNAGLPDARNNSGSGIVLGSVDGGVIERSLARDNGRLHGLDREGPVGIWAYDSRRIVIQDNRSLRNRTAGRTDGGGFDFDQNVSESVMQRNLSADNDGAGFMLAHGPEEGAIRGIVIRQNVSRNDGRKNAYGGLHVWGRVLDTIIHGNVVQISPAPGAQPTVIHVSTVGAAGAPGGLVVSNNTFRTRGGVPLLNVPPRALEGLVVFHGNVHEPAGGARGFARVIWSSLVGVSP